MNHDKEWVAVMLSLLREQRTASLATLTSEHNPYLSMIPYAIDTERGSFSIHISELADHYKNLSEVSDFSAILVTKCEEKGKPVHALPRISIQTHNRFLSKDDVSYQRMKRVYLERFPEADFMFAFKDFHLVELEPIAIRLVTGFGSARHLNPKQFKLLLQSF